MADCIELKAATAVLTYSMLLAGVSREHGYLPPEPGSMLLELCGYEVQFPAELWEKCIAIALDGYMKRPTILNDTVELPTVINWSWDGVVSDPGYADVLYLTIEYVTVLDVEIPLQDELLEVLGELLAKELDEQHRAMEDERAEAIYEARRERLHYDD